jgi:hypothetical protein
MAGVFLLLNIFLKNRYNFQVGEQVQAWGEL